MASSLKFPYSGKCLSIITGASRGYGRTIAQLLCNKEHGILGNAAEGSRIILLSRNVSEMEKTKELIENQDGKFEVNIVPVDLYNVESSAEVIEKMLASCSTDFEHAFLFNNASCLGDPSKAVPDYNDIHEIQKVFTLNVITGSFLIARFCKYFQAVKNKFVIQISTLAAVQPFPCTGLYSSSKACMDMFLRNLATDCPEIRALNYAPGPMDTQMSRDLWTHTANEGTKEYFTGLFTEGRILSTEESAKKLMMLLRKNEFENAAHIDFYEI